MFHILLTRVIVGDIKTAIWVQVLLADIGFQDIIHEGGRLSELYRDVTKAELQKKKKKPTHQKVKRFQSSHFYSFRNQRVLKLQNLLLSHHKKRL